ncbi:MAG: sigma-54 dependent transcriptional regulator [bacterium]
MARILIVDDEANIRRTLQSALERRDHQVDLADSIAAARPQTDQGYDLILLDVMLPDGSGLDLLDQILLADSGQTVVMISGHADVDMAVAAIRRGAYDFIEKPISLERLLVTIDNAVRTTAMNQASHRLARSVYGHLIGESPAMVALRESVAKSAPKATRFLITGENGTGKELVAHLIHQSSQFSGGPFVAVNCAALPRELIEAELFGHTAGAFTGAGKARNGHFVQAHQGSIFLDEISEMPPAAQAKILRTLETRTVIPLGSGKEIKVEGNVIAATNRDVDAMVKEGSFRQDLLYRLNVVQYQLPPLRQRPQDIPLLLDHFLARFATETKSAPKRLTKSSLQLLSGYEFPGNVRELRNLAERIGIYCDRDEVDPAQLRSLLPLTGDQSARLKDAVDDFERDFISSVIKRHNGNFTRAARELGLERSHLYKKAKKLGLDRQG